MKKPCFRPGPSCSSWKATRTRRTARVTSRSIENWTASRLLPDYVRLRKRFRICPDSNSSNRTVMRADATHRLILNAKVFPKMHFELVENKYVRFSVLLGDSLKTYLAKVRIELLCSSCGSDSHACTVWQPYDGQAAGGCLDGSNRAHQAGQFGRFASLAFWPVARGLA
jgi:hypothetical protein